MDRPSADETPEQAQRRELTAQHGAEVADAILSGNVLQEMTMEQVQLARGSPARKEVIPPDAELWHYPAGEVAFSAGKVSYVSLESKTEAISDESSAETKHAQSEAGSNFEQGQPAVFSSDVLAEKTIVNSPGDGFLALRSEPSTRRGVRLRKIPHATPLVLDECIFTSRTARWCRTTFKGTTGWVLDRYLRKTNDGRNHALGGRLRSPPKGDPVRSAIMDAIRTEYSRPVLFLVHDLKVSGDWAWVEVTGTINGRQEYEPNAYVLHKEREKWKVMDSVNASDPSVVYQRYEELSARFPEAPIP